MANFYQGLLTQTVKASSLRHACDRAALDAFISWEDSDLPYTHVPMSNYEAGKVVSHALDMAVMSLVNYGDHESEIRVYSSGTLVLQTGVSEQYHQPDMQVVMSLSGLFATRESHPALHEVIQMEFSRETLRHAAVAETLSCRFSPVSFEDIEEGNIPPTFATNWCRTPVMASESRAESIAVTVSTRKADVSRSDICSLNMRVAVALAARSCWRAYEHWVRSTKGTASRAARDAVKEAIAIATEFSQGTALNETFRNRAAFALHRLEKHVLDARFGDNSWEFDIGRMNIPESAYNALAASLQGAGLSLTRDERLRRVIVDSVVRSVEQAIVQGYLSMPDWEWATSHGSGCIDDLGDALDPGPRGPFGCL